jgi:hypothetical protein
MTPEQLFTPAALDSVRDHPQFGEAADAMVARTLKIFAQTDANGRWMFRDLGRGRIYLQIILLDASESGATAAELTLAAEANRISSRGRVISFLQRAQEAGDISLAPGDGPWTRRRLILAPAFIERFREGLINYAGAAGRVASDVTHLTDRLRDDKFLAAYNTHVVPVYAAAAATGSTSPRSEHLFLERDRGMSILFRLMTLQERPRARLLVAAPISRNGLAREFDVSRIHINRLLAEAAAQGLLSLPAPDRVVFSPTLSDDVERMLATTMQLTRGGLLAAEAALQTARGG